ncbi:MAG: hypothetical protein H8D86_01220 [Planctomycetes bacterium]|nr:hypothetical protein [Planctomycetota bacterium]
MRLPKGSPASQENAVATRSGAGEGRQRIDRHRRSHACDDEGKEIETSEL